MDVILRGSSKKNSDFDCLETISQGKRKVDVNQYNEMDIIVPILSESKWEKKSGTRSRF